MRVLCLDLGSKRIGVAVSDASATIATPHSVIRRSPQFHKELRVILDEYEVEQLVVGLPLSLDGSVGPAAKGVLAEVEVLRDTFSLPTDTYDERLSTVTAERVLHDANVDSRQQRAVVDKVAAAVILQAWLDRQRMLDIEGTGSLP